MIYVTTTVVVCWSMSEKPVVKIRTCARRTALVFFILFGWSDTSLLHPVRVWAKKKEKKRKKEFGLWCIFRPRDKISTHKREHHIIIIIISSSSNMRCFWLSCRRRSDAAAASGGDFARSSVEEEKEDKEDKEEVWFDANEVFVEEKEHNGGREAAAAPFSSSFSSLKPALFRGGVSKLSLIHISEPTRPY